MKITENIYVVAGVVANPYILVDADGLTVIDTGLPRAEKKILAYIANLGRAPQDVKRIILTHSDLDHVGGLSALQKATSARTFTSKIEADAIAIGRASRQITGGGLVRRVLFAVVSPFFKAIPVQVDEILTDGQILPIAGGLRVLDTPGHTPGHISLFSESAGVLFCGDSMISENGLQGSRPAVTWDQMKANESVVKQAQLDARIVCSGHGPVVMDAKGKYPV